MTVQGHKQMNDIPPLYGWNKTSEAGEELFALSVFLGRCNYQCQYCMNSKLVPHNVQAIERSWEPIWDYLSKNKVPYVQISGGEPTLTPVPKLLSLFEKIKSYGPKVGMSTNGSMTEVLRKIIPEMNYVTMDIKTDAKRYQDLAQDPRGNPEFHVWNSYALLCDNADQRDDFAFEVRTTLYPLHVDADAIREIGKGLRKDTRWRLQPFRHAKNMLSEIADDVEPYTKEQNEELLAIAKEYIDDVAIRYV